MVLHTRIFCSGPDDEQGAHEIVDGYCRFCGKKFHNSVREDVDLLLRVVGAHLSMYWGKVKTTEEARDYLERRFGKGEDK